MTKAISILNEKRKQDDGSIIELVIWKLPEPVPGSGRDYKYRLYYGNNGERLVGYDNERGKGDHKHLLDMEYSYTFSNIDDLIRDFLNDIRKVKK